VSDLMTISPVSSLGSFGVYITSSVLDSPGSIVVPSSSHSTARNSWVPSPSVSLRLMLSRVRTPFPTLSISIEADVSPDGCLPEVELIRG
jgi:hypothetical protein